MSSVSCPTSLKFEDQKNVEPKLDPSLPQDPIKAESKLLWSRRITKNTRKLEIQMRKNKMRFDAVYSTENHSNFKQLAIMLLIATKRDDYGGLDYIMSTRFAFDEFGPNTRGLRGLKRAVL